MFSEILYKTDKLVFFKDEQANYIIKTKDNIENIEAAKKIVINVFSIFFENKCKSCNSNVIVGFSDELDYYSINLISGNEILITEMSVSEFLQLSLKKLPISWSKISNALANNEFTIRSKGRDPIPKRYHKKLLELIEVLEKWKNKYT